MDMTQDFRVLLLPGWENSGPDHWQSRWETRHGFQRVEQDDWLWPKRGDWMARLEEVLLQSDQPALLVAHSLGCQLVAAWAAHSRHTQRVAGALLVAPPDVERDDMPPNLYSWRPIARKPLPFPALVVYSEDDPFCQLGAVRTMVNDWEAQSISVGDAGHINGASGLGEWPDGMSLLRGLMATARPAGADPARASA